MQEDLKDLNIIQLKALAFDIDQQMKMLQNQYMSVINILKEKIASGEPPAQSIQVIPRDVPPVDQSVPTE